MSDCCACRTLFGLATRPPARPPAGFLAMQARQKLMVEFCDYPQMLITNFSKCINDPHK